MRSIAGYLILLFSLPVVAFAQTEKDMILFNKVANLLESYQRKLPEEKLYVHQDRTRYLAGETIWFKIYRSFSSEYPVNSGVVYVDLINGMNQPVVESKWELNNGSTSGQVILPDTLSEGRYLLRAYTKWMQNLGVESFFTRELYITSFHNDSSILKDQLSVSSSLRLAFFPEGGNLVAGIPSKVAFKATDNEGRFQDIKGVIYDDAGKEIRHFSTMHSGQGYFYIEPESGRQYYAVPDDSPQRIPLPEIYQDGVVMGLSYRDDRLRISLRHNPEQKENSRSFYLTIYKDDKSWYNAPINMDNEVNVYDIPYSQLPEGVFTITLYDDRLYAYCERLAFVNYPEFLSLKLKTDKQTNIGKREKVTVELANEADSDSIEEGDFSVAVVKSGLDNTQTRNNFYTDYFLRSELKERIEDPASYFDRRDSTGLQKMDLLLLTHGWRRYVWKKIISDKTPEAHFYVEPGLTLSGKVLPFTKRGKLDDIEVTAHFRHDSIGSFLSFNPAEDGTFVITDCHFQDTAEVILSAKNTKGRTFNLAMDKDSVLSSDYYTYNKTYLRENYDFDVEISGEMLKKKAVDIDKEIHQLPGINVTARKKTPKNYHQKLHNETFSFATYKTIPGYSYSIGGGKTGALAILEFIPKVKTLKRLAIVEEPSYFLDGMMITEEALRGISPTLIEQVELLLPAQAMIYSSKSKAGAVMFWTKDWTSRIGTVESKTIVHRFIGYNQEKEFYSPDYSVFNDSQTPDYRSTLYWDPDLTINSDGRIVFSFFTSDDPGEYIIHCEGRSGDGKIGVTHCLFTTD